MLNKPEDREEAVAKLFKNAGGKLIGWYLTFGHHDWMVIGEFPDEKAAASAILAAAAGGSLSDTETTVAMTSKEAATDFQVGRQGGEALPQRRTLVGTNARRLRFVTNPGTKPGRLLIIPFGTCRKCPEFARIGGKNGGDWHLFRARKRAESMR